MKRYLLAAVAAMLMIPGSGGAHAVRHAPPAVAAKTCSSSYTKAKIGGVTKCLRRGEYCAKAYKSTYRRYGFTCSGSPARLH